MKFLGIDLDGLWWSIARGLMQIIDWLGQAFNFLVGADTVNASANEGKGDNISNLFVTIFNGTEGSANMTRLYLMIMIGSVAFLCIFIAIGAVKAQFTKSPTDSLQSIGSKSLFTLIKMIAIPIVFFVALQAMGYIFNFLISVMNHGSNSASLAQSLCDACCSGGVTVQFDMDYDALKGALEGSGGEFNYLMCILAAAFLVVTLVTVSITLTKRIIEVFFYYLSAPIALCRTPLDDGKSFDLWKENVVSKLLSAGGIIICMYLYYAIIPLFNDAVAQWQAADPKGSRDIIANVLKILFVIGGSCVPASASMLMAQLISQGTGQNESNNMMHTQQMMGNALHLAGAAGSRAVLGALGGAGKAGTAVVGGAAKAVKMAGGAVGLSGGGGGAAAAALGGAASGVVSGAAGAASGGGFGGGVGAAARTGAAAMAAFSGAGGAGAAAAGAPVGGSVGVAARAPSGATASASRGFGGNVLGNIKSSYGKARQKVANTNPLLGAAGKVGSMIGAGVRLAGGVITAAPKAAVQSLAHKVANTKAGRHFAHRWEEKKEARRLKKEGRAEATAAQRTTGKYSSLDRAMQLDGAGGTGNTSAYMIAKMDAYEARAQKVESYLSRRSGWSEETKQQYRRSQLESEASRISAYADVARDRMNDDSINRFKSFYGKMSRDLYGEDAK